MLVAREDLDCGKIVRCSHGVTFWNHRCQDWNPGKKLVN
jgi:hypothetical protein